MLPLFSSKLAIAAKASCLLLLLLAINPLWGQGQSTDTVDVVHLKDGNVLKGDIKGFGNDSVSIVIGGGQLLKFPRSRIEKIEFNVKKGGGSKREEKGSSEEGKGKEKDPPSQSSDYYRPDAEIQEMEGPEDPWPYHRKGYQHHLAHGWFSNVGNTRADLSFLTNIQAYSIHTYWFSPRFAAGIYAGLQLHNNFSTGNSGELFNSFGVVGTGDLLKGSVITPFYEVQAGLSHGFGNFQRSGFFGNFGLGGKAYFGNSKGISILLSYQLYRMQNRFNTTTGRVATRYLLVKGMGIRITLHL